MNPLQTTILSKADLQMYLQTLSFFLEWFEQNCKLNKHYYYFYRNNKIVCSPLHPGKMEAGYGSVKPEGYHLRKLNIIYSPYSLTPENFLWSFKVLNFKTFKRVHFLLSKLSISTHWEINYQLWLIIINYWFFYPLIHPLWEYQWLAFSIFF